MTLKEHEDWIRRYDERIERWKNENKNHPNSNEVIEGLKKERTIHRTHVRRIKINDIFSDD